MEKGKTGKKRLPAWARIMIILVAALLVLALAAFVLGLGLLNRVSRPDAPTVFEPDDEAIEDGASPAPSLAPPHSGKHEPAGATPAPALPVEDLYPQTHLGASELARMEYNNVDKNYVNILLIGVDRRKTTGKSRADTMMIATLDKKHGLIKLTTLMRDTLVDIPGRGYGKLNSAAAYGGVDLLMETINANYHLNISDYVLVDFFMFTDIIDKLGGVVIDMTAEEISAANDCIAGLNKQLGVENPWDGFIFANPGPIKLTGKQALGYARIRKIDSEFARTDRQFKILNTVYAMFRSKSATRQYGLLYDLLPFVETDLSNADIIELALSALTMNAKGISHSRMPFEGHYENGRYERSFVFLSDIPANAQEIHTFIYDSDEKGRAAELLDPNPSLDPRTPMPTGFDPGGAAVTPDESGVVRATKTPSEAPAVTPEPTPPPTDATPGLTPEPTQPWGVPSSEPEP